MPAPPKVVVENVNTPGRTARVDAGKYAAMRRALLQTLPRRTPGLTQAQMVAAVGPLLPQALWPDGDKATWWVKTVQLDLEAKGLVGRDASSRPLRWHRIRRRHARAPAMIRGSCLCGAVRYALDGTPQFINHCHCSMCRKAHGAAFGSFLHADGTRFRWVAGEANVARYPSSPGNVRAFCTTCGASVPVLEDDGAHVIIPAGTLDDDPLVRPIVHLHTASKAPWYAIADDLPQFAAFPPDAFREPWA